MSSSAIGSSMIAVGKSNFVSSATGLVQEGVPLSRLHEIKTPKVSSRARANRLEGAFGCLDRPPA